MSNALHSLNKKTREKLSARYGSWANSLLETCPYQMAVLQDIPFAAADEYVMESTKIDELCPKRIANALLYTLTVIEKGIRTGETDTFSQMVSGIAGSTCIPKSEAYSFIEELLGLEEESISLSLLNLAIKHLAITGKISVNRIGDQIFLATKNTYRAEKEAADRVCELLKAPGLIEGNEDDLKNMYKAIDSSMASTGMILSQEQKNAVSMVMQNRISVLTGGPGTGKSATEKVLIESFRTLKKDASIRCIAPTGMAAMRMNEATGCEASTIHKALGLMPGEEKSQREISDDLLLVDEASMIDIFILSSLLNSVSDKTTVVFIGDVAQLPSISAGNILENLISSKVPVTELTKVFRQGDNSIAFNCAKIKTGNTLLDEDASFTFIECDDSDAIQKEVCRLYSEEVKRSGIDSVCCLSPYRRKTKTGVNQLNRAIRKAISEEFHGYCERDGLRIYTGDKITFLRNRDGLVNGDTGTAVKCYEGTCVAKFGDIELTLTGEDLFSIEPAFAQTVHKAQGQEYKTCIIVCDEAHLGFLSRNLVYTSVSRAKEKCICIGSKKAMQKAILDENSGPARYGALKILINQHD